MKWSIKLPMEIADYSKRLWNKKVVLSIFVAFIYRYRRGFLYQQVLKNCRRQPE